MMRRAGSRFGLVTLFVTVFAVSAWALQRPITSRFENYQDAPVVIRKVETSMIETFATPSQYGSASFRQRGSRVRYANRAGLTVSKFDLSGEVVCRNHSRKTVEAFEVTIIPLDVFHEPVRAMGQRGRFATEQVIRLLPRGSTTKMEWYLPTLEGEVYEVALVVTRVRFKDGTIWEPTEELIDSY